MFNNISYSPLAQAVSHINNPNYATGTLLEEVPCTLGRTRAGFKRGGTIEGMERFRKESMSALVWLFGIRAFNKLGNLFFEHVLKTPMISDFCKKGEGNNCIQDTVDFLAQGFKTKEEALENVPRVFGDRFKNVDYSILIEKYGDKFKGVDTEKLVRKIKGAKMISSLSALVFNCVMMGVILPKVNQAITRKKLQEQKVQSETPLKYPSFGEFSKNTNSNKSQGSQISFGGIDLENMVYRIDNDNRYRLVATDIPMLIGRVATSRNKYEALENIMIDGGSMYFYNFCAGHVQKLLRNNSKVPNIDPKIAEYIAVQGEDALKNAYEQIEQNKTSIMDLFEPNVAKEIYKGATYGKYGHIEKFVKTQDLENIDSTVVKFLNYIKDKAKATDGVEKQLFVDGKINEDILKDAVKKINRTNALYLASGLAVSILGLALIVPKVTYWVTKKITGKDEFTGITDYSDNSKVKKSNKK